MCCVVRQAGVLDIVVVAGGLSARTSSGERERDSLRQPGAGDLHLVHGPPAGTRSRRRAATDAGQGHPPRRALLLLCRQQRRGQHHFARHSQRAV